MSWMAEQLLEWAAERLLEVLTWVMDTLAATTFVVPDVAGLPAVEQIWQRNIALVNTAYVLAIVAAGVVAMTHETVQVRYSIKDLVPRLVLGAVASNFSLAWCSQILQIADRVTAAVAGAPLDDEQSLQVLRGQITAALTNLEVAVLSLVVAAVAVVLLLLLTLQWIIRLGVLLVLAVAGPFALAAYCLPQLDAAAGLWWRTLFGTLATHVLQALTLYTGISVFINPDGQLGSLLPVSAASQTANLLVLMVLLLACVKIPGLVRSYLLRGGGGSGTRAVAVMVWHQVTRAVAAGRAGASARVAGGVR